MRYKLPLTFLLSFCRDRIPDKGEDSECHSFCEFGGMVGAFDGCGGAGARTQGYYSGRTEAYMASRICSGAFYDCFRMWFDRYGSTEQFAKELLWPTAVNQLVRYQAPQDPNAIQIRGSMVRTLPTTAAVAILRQLGDGSVEVSAHWAGDSRVYLLDGNGLAQLTVDNTTVTDPMLNVYEDGVLRNMFAADRPVQHYSNRICVRPPFVVFAATDGCFGYVSTPMEFEGLVLQTLLNAENPARWEQNLADAVGRIAGDDHTLSLAAIGYESFRQLQQSLAPRYDYLWHNYLTPLQGVPVEHREPRFALWEQFRPNYYRFLKDGLI